jgi:sulfur carrier protein ThiS
MVIVSYEGTVLPHSTPIKQDVVLLVTTISSGG